MTVDPDVAQAYTGRLGNVDATYADPNLANIVSKEAAEPEEEPEPAPAPETPPPETSPGTVEEPAEAEEADDDEDVPVESLTVDQLKDELDGWGVEYSTSDRKADLQEKLRAARG